jgi:hypothetical protein
MEGRFCGGRQGRSEGHFCGGRQGRNRGPFLRRPAGKKWRAVSAAAGREEVEGRSCGGRQGRSGGPFSGALLGLTSSRLCEAERNVCLPPWPSEIVHQPRQDDMQKQAGLASSPEGGGGGAVNSLYMAAELTSCRRPVSTHGKEQHLSCRAGLDTGRGGGDL